MDQVISVILAGGEGTRLFPLTRCRCKPDVRFAGRYRLIDIPISNSINSKIQKIFVLTQHFTASLHQHILSTYPHKIDLLSPKDLPEKNNLYKGTADAVRQNLDQILHATAEYVLILAGDQLYNMNYHKMIDFAKKSNAELVIAALPVIEKDAKRMGLLKLDEHSNIVDFYEKPTNQILDRFALPSDPNQPQQYLGSMGIYVFKKAALFALLQEEGNDFGKHIIPNQLKMGKTSAFVYNGYWEDIGTISAYYQANLALTNEHNWMQQFNENNRLYAPHAHISTPLIKQGTISKSLINQGTIIEAQKVTQSIIGLNTWIKEGSTICDSIITGDSSSTNSVVIGKKCIIQRAIIDSDVIIGDNVQLINQNHLQKYDSENVYIREGIIIVPTGARIFDNFII